MEIVSKKIVFFVFFYYQCFCLAKVLNVNEKFLNQSLSPVILVPGDGGCQLQARWHKPTTVGYFCSKNEAEWTDLWLAMSELSPYAIYCFIDNVRLVYNRENHTTSNSPGVETRIPGFGGTDTVDWLDTFIHIGITEYFSAITERLVKMGYQKNVTIKGAPFDFRKAPNELLDYFTALHELIEETYKSNNNLKVTLIAHSMGAPILHTFLNRQTQSWKDTHIQSIISLSGAWGGSIKPVKVYAIGDNLGSRFLSASTLRPLQISFPSLAFVMPSRELWGSPDDIIIMTPEKNYTIFDIEEYFIALNNTDGYEMYKNAKDILYKVPPPQVEIHCLHGLQVPTTNRLLYPTQKDFPWAPTLMVGDGDGTVNQRSLEQCLRWARVQKQKIYHKIFPKVDHMQILTEKNVSDYISQYLSTVQKNNVVLLESRVGIKSGPDFDVSIKVDNSIQRLIFDKELISDLGEKVQESSNLGEKRKKSSGLTDKGKKSSDLTTEAKRSSKLKTKMVDIFDNFDEKNEIVTKLSQVIDENFRLNLPQVPPQNEEEFLINVKGIGT